MRSILFFCALVLVAVLLVQERMQKLPSTVVETYGGNQNAAEQQPSNRSGSAESVAPSHSQGGAEFQNVSVEREPTTRRSNYSRELALPRGPGGHYYLDARVNGVQMTFLVDTGASDVALGAEHAKQLRLRLKDSDFTRRYETANGVVRGAPVELQQIEVGRLKMRGIEASVLESELAMPLLGMSFLNRLKGYEVRGDQLVLRF